MPTGFFPEIAANSQNNFPRRFQCVKFSRIAREVHASAAKLFTKKWRVAGDK
jgi:hypothetical protein